MARKPPNRNSDRPRKSDRPAGPVGKPTTNKPLSNKPKFRPNTPKGTTFKKPALELFSTTLWDYPSQHYLPTNPDAPSVQGDPNYTGATPSWIIWQLLQRYTKPGDTVLDPMCGSGTTIDVCTDLQRKPIAFDVNPTRPDITANDARTIPLPDRSCDFVFIDPPYSTHVHYSDQPACIGRLDAGGRDRGRDYYRAMSQVIAEIARVLKPDRHMALYVSDSRHEGDRAEFMPIGFELFTIMREHLEPVDIIAVVRRNAKLKQRNRREQSLETNTFERGFNYLFIMRKPGRPPRTERPKRDQRPAQSRFNSRKR